MHVQLRGGLELFFDTLAQSLTGGISDEGRRRSLISVSRASYPNRFVSWTAQEESMFPHRSFPHTQAAHVSVEDPASPLVSGEYHARSCNT
jgi:hypothetical protein